MLKLATEQALKVQLVRESEPLAALGGVGCLLRHATLASRAPAASDDSAGGARYACCERLEDAR